MSNHIIYYLYHYAIKYLWRNFSFILAFIGEEDKGNFTNESLYSRWSVFNFSDQIVFLNVWESEYT